jgi:hypothetical protein
MIKHRSGRHPGEAFASGISHIVIKFFFKYFRIKEALPAITDRTYLHTVVAVETVGKIPDEIFRAKGNPVEFGNFGLGVLPACLGESGEILKPLLGLKGEQTCLKPVQE